jgi:hypothetical protein
MKDPLLMELLQLHRIGVLRQVLETNRIIGQQAIIKAEDIHDEKSQCEQLDCLEADKNQEENEEDSEMSFIIAIKPNKVKVVEEGSDVNNKLNVDDLSLVMNQMNISESFDSPTRLIDEDDKYIDDDFPINLDVLVLNEKKSVCDSSNSCRNKNGKLQLFQKSKAPLKDITNVANFHNNAINKCTPKSNKVMVESVNNSFLVADNWIHCSFSPICASSFQVDSHEMADCAMTNDLSDSIVDNEVMVDVALDSDDKNAHGNMVPLQLHNRKRPAPRTTKYDNIVNKIQQNEFYGASYVRYSAPTDEFIKETLLEYFNRSEHTRSGNLMNLGGLIIITTKAKIDAWANVVRSHLSNRLLVYNAETLKSRRLKGTTGLSLLYYDIIITTFDLIKAKDMKVSKQELNSYLTGRKQEDWYELGDRGNASEDRSYLQLLRWKQSIVDFGDTKTCKFDSVKGAAVCNLVSDHRTLMVQTCSEELDGVKEVANIQKMLKLESKTPLAKITINYT